MRHRLSYHPKQGREVDDFTILFKTIGVYILAQQSYFLIAFGRKVGYFIQDTFHITTTLTTTSIRHNAIVAEIVTSTHNAYKARNVVTTNARRDNIAISFGCREFHIDSLLAGFYRCYQFGKSQICVGTCHQIHMMVLDQVFLHTLGHTAQYTHNNLSSLASFVVHGMEEFQTVQNLLFCIVAHRTSIHKHSICFIE